MMRTAVYEALRPGLDRAEGGGRPVGARHERASSPPPAKRSWAVAPAPEILVGEGWSGGVVRCIRMLMEAWIPR